MARAVSAANAYTREVTGALSEYTVLILESEFAEPGDIFAPLTYPTYFTERPFVSVYAETNPGSPVVAGAYPRLSNPVVTPVTELFEGGPVYTGAVALVTMEAEPGTSGTLRWKIEGKAPVGSVWNPIDEEG